MESLKSPLTLLETNASTCPSSPAFRLPRVDLRTSQVQEWVSITHAQFKQDVELSAKYWVRTLKAIPPRSTVGIWVGGFTYLDVLHVYGVSRAGYVPQMFSLRLPNPQIIFELLQRANAKALIYDSSIQSDLSHSPVPTYFAIDARTTNVTTGDLPSLPTTRGSDTAIIFHTSGSTSGSPKLVPISYSWLTFMLDKNDQATVGLDSGKQMVGVWTGSVGHAAQNFVLWWLSLNGGCMVQPTTMPCPSEEMIDIIERCGLNQIIQFSSYFSKYLQSSRSDAKLLSSLRKLASIGCGGLAMPYEDEEWAHQNDIKFRNLFASTECGFLMISGIGKDPSSRLLRPMTGVSYEFRPIGSETKSESGHEPTTKLLELVVLADSGDCPDRSLRHSDGHFHTGDLFEEVIPGYYASRGRDDDWIKSENSLRCDTKAIEDNVRDTCGHLVQECVVVGYGRPSPTLFVEPASVDIDPDQLKKYIIRATRQFHSRRYLHERITSEKMIVVVPPKTLPRTSTKGNIRRKAVEETYKDELEAIYSSV